MAGAYEMGVGYNVLNNLYRYILWAAANERNLPWVILIFFVVGFYLVKKVASPELWTFTVKNAIFGLIHAGFVSSPNIASRIP